MVSRVALAFRNWKHRIFSQYLCTSVRFADVQISLVQIIFLLTFWQRACVSFLSAGAGCICIFLSWFTKQILYFSRTRLEDKKESNSRKRRMTRRSRRVPHHRTWIYRQRGTYVVLTMVHVFTLVNRVGDTEHVSPAIYHPFLPAAKPSRSIGAYFLLLNLSNCWIFFCQRVSGCYLNLLSTKFWMLLIFF